MGCKSSKSARRVQEPMPEPVQEPVQEEPVQEPVQEPATEPEPVKEPAKESVKESPAPLKAMGGMLSGAMSGAKKVVLEKTISTTEAQADELAPACVKPLYCCCGGPVGTMSLMGCAIPTEQRDKFYKGVESYYIAKVELAALNAEEGGCCCGLCSCSCCCCPCC